MTRAVNDATLTYEGEKLKRLKGIGAVSKKKEETFRSQYNRIFTDSYDENRLLVILDKFIIDAAKTSIVGISGEFSKYIRSISEGNRDGYIGQKKNLMIFAKLKRQHMVPLDVIAESYRKIAKEARGDKDFVTEEWAMTSGGLHYFHVCLWFYPINVLIYGLGGVLSGVGDTLIAGIHSLASILVKLLVTVLLIGKLGLLSIAIASCLGWCVASVIVVMRYKGNKWQSKAVVKMIQN